MANQALPSLVESDTVAHVVGKTAIIKKDFLEPALPMGAPVIRRMWLRGLLNIDTGAGPDDAKGGMLSHFMGQFLMKDRSGQRINISGGELRAIAQQELGFGYQDPPDIAQNQAGVDVEVYIPIILTLADRQADPDDSGLVLPDFYSGGEITLNFNPSDTINGGAAQAAAITINSGTWSICAEVVDEVTPVLKARLSWLSQALQSNDQSYPVNGKVRTAMLYVGDENEEDGSTWGTTPQDTLESRSFNFLALPQSLFIERHREEGYQDPTQDMVESNVILPMQVTHRGSKIGNQPVFNNLHVKFSQNLPVNSTLLTGVWTSRSPQTIALTFRAVPPSSLKEALKNRAVVPGLRGDVAAAAFPDSQRAYLPIKLGSVAGDTAPPVTPPAQAVR